MSKQLQAVNKSSFVSWITIMKDVHILRLLQSYPI